jgi:peroxiredoxin
MDTLISNGQSAPDFTLPGLDGSHHSLKDYRGHVVVLNFWSAECPHAQRSDQELTSYLESWGEKVALLCIASNANEPPDLLSQVAAERRLPVVLHDPHQQVADLYGAVTTPHVFVIDQGGILRYQGAFDDVTFRQRTPSQHYLRQAVEAVLSGQKPNPQETSSYGCAIVRYADIS